MPQKKTKTDEVPSGLTDQQLLVLDGMLAGQKQVDLAETVGVTPETISRWKRDPVFQAEHNRRRREVSSLASERLRRLQLDALDVLADMLTARTQKDRYNAAMALLNLGKVQVEVPGTDDPDQIRLEQAERDQDRLFRRAIAGG